VSRPRFYCADLSADRIELDTEQARHALGSLRLRRGDAVELFDGCGGVAQCELVEAESAGKRRSAIVSVHDRQSLPRPTRSLTLFVAGAKGPRLTTLVEKCTELGVSALRFTDWQRSVVHVGDSGLEKLRKTAIEACKQCGRNWLPELTAGNSLADILGFAGQCLIAHPGRMFPCLSQVIDSEQVATALAIGPEGGFEEAELEQLTAGGAECVRLGEHILRVETAALASAAIWSASR
jgi:16S rRNA (uracil1498-N3)-methyltransferase